MYCVDVSSARQVVTAVAFVSRSLMIMLMHHSLQNSLLAGMDGFEMLGKVGVLQINVGFRGQSRREWFGIGNVLPAVLLVLFALNGGKAKGVRHLVADGLLRDDYPNAIGLLFQKAGPEIVAHGGDDGSVDFGLLLLGMGLFVFVKMLVDQVTEQCVARMFAKRGILATAQDVRVQDFIDVELLEANGNCVHVIGRNHWRIVWCFLIL